MTDFHVNQDLGLDSNAGTVEAPIKTFGLALDKAEAADRVLMVGGDSTYYRGELITAAEYIVKPTVDGEYIHQLPAINVSNGADRNPILLGGDGEAWVSDSVPYSFGSGNYVTVNITGSSTVTRSEISHSGVNAFLLTRADAGNLSQLIFRAYKAVGEEITIDLFQRYVTGTNRPRIEIRHGSSGEYWNAGTQLWQGGLVQNDLFTGSATYRAESVTIPTDPSGFAPGDYFKITFHNTTNTSSVLIDDITITGEFSTYAWVADQGTTYVLDDLVFQNGETARQLLKSTTSEWDSDKADSLRHVNLAADLSTCRSTSGTAFYDDTTGSLYYTLESGESITDLHLEFVFKNASTLTAHANTITGLCVHGGRTAIRNTGGAVFYDSHAYDTAVGTDTGIGFDSVTSASGKNNDCSAVRCDGFVANAVAAEYNHCMALHSWDDGFQSIAGGGITGSGSLALFTGLEQSSGNDGISCEEADSYLDINGWLSYGGQKNGITLGTDYGNSTVSNSLSFGNNLGASPGQGDVKALTSANSLTWDYNAYGTTADNAPTPGANDITAVTADILIDILESLQTMSNSELRAWLKTSRNLIPAISQLVGTGSPKWWGTAPRPKSCSGEPVPDINIDIGPQSTHSPFHPVNL